MTLRLNGSTSGHVEIDAPAVAGSTSITLPATSGGEFVVSDSAGRVGIGTAAPSTLLHLEGDTDPELRVVDTTNSVTGFVKATNGSVDIGSGSNHSLQFYTNNTQAFRVTATTDQDFKFNSGFGSVGTAYGCRAWVNFNGTGTVAIRDSGNVSSITDNGAGTYAVNFTNSMPDANYSLTGSAQYNGTDNCWVEWSDNKTSTTDKVEVHIAKAGALIDSPRISIAIHR